MSEVEAGDVSATDVLRAVVRERAHVHVDRRAARAVKVLRNDGSIATTDSVAVLSSLLERERIAAQTVGRQVVVICSTCRMKFERPSRRSSVLTCPKCTDRARAKAVRDIAAQRQAPAGWTDRVLQACEIEHGD